MHRRMLSQQWGMCGLPQAEMTLPGLLQQVLHCHACAGHSGTTSLQRHPDVSQVMCMAIIPSAQRGRQVWH